MDQLHQITKVGWILRHPKALVVEQRHHQARWNADEIQMPLTKVHANLIRLIGLEYVLITINRRP